MTPRTVPAGEPVRRGRTAKAEQFAAAAGLVHDLADEASDVADAYVTLCVHAGIAARAHLARDGLVLSQIRAYALVP